MFATVGLGAQDRPILTLTPESSPVVLDEGIFFLVGQLASMSVSNRYTEPVLVRLRAWIFDQAGRFKGTNGYCSGEWLDRSMRRVISIPIEVRDLTSTDTVVASIDSVLSDGRQWAVRESIAEQLEAARVRAASGGGRLALQETDRPDVAAGEFCPCECPAIAQACEAFCFETSLQAFTCSPTATSGCSASCTCK